MAAYHAYLDDSGRFPSGDPFVVFCGYVSTADVWQQFSERWNGYLFEHSLPPVHMSDMIHFDGEWARKKELWGKQAESMLRSTILNLAGMVPQIAAMPVGGAVDGNYFRGMRNSPFKKRADDPHYLVFQQAVLESLEYIDCYALNQTLSVIIDDDEKYCVECYKLLNKMKLRPNAAGMDIRRRVQGICFGNDRYYATLQLADMLAYCAREELMARVKKIEVPDLIKDVYTVLTARGKIRLFESETLDELERTTLD